MMVNSLKALARPGLSLSLCASQPSAKRSYGAGRPVGGEGLPTSAATGKKSVREGPSKPSPLGFLQMPPVILPRQATNL
jgi:hypothetical protein